MKLFIAVIFLLGSFNVIISGKIIQKQERVIGGNIATEDQFPWNAAIHFNNVFICSGALISNYFILTAAESVIEYVTLPEFMSVKLGSLSPYYDPAVPHHPVWHVVTHPAYWVNDTRGGSPRDDMMHHNNIAVVMLRSPVEFGDTIQPIALPAMGAPQVGDGVNVQLCGWGHEFGSTISELEFVYLFTMNVDTCIIQAGGDPNIDHDFNICTAPYNPTGHDAGACLYDHGAPLVTTYTPTFSPMLMGLVSYANCDEGSVTPTIYASVVGHRDWVFRATGM